MGCCGERTTRSLLEGRDLRVKLENGGVGERLNPAVLKTVRPERVSGVRIPPPPPLIASKRLATMVQAARRFFLESEYFKMREKMANLNVTIVIRTTNPERKRRWVRAT